MKKSGVFDKAQVKSGVVEGGINALVKQVKKKEVFNSQNGVRVAIYVPIELRNNFKSILAKRGSSIQDHLYEYVSNFVEKNQTDK